MDGRRAVLGPADVHAALIKLDLMPLEIADLRGPQSMTVSDQDHGRVSMSVAAMLAGIVHELFDLAASQVFPNCTVYSVWWAGIPSLIPHLLYSASDCGLAPSMPDIVRSGASRRRHTLPRLALLRPDRSI